jgi:CheY-like chemotaxis protein
LFVADSNKAHGVVLKGILKALGVAIVFVGSQSEFISVIESKQVDMAVISCASDSEHVSTTLHEIRFHHTSNLTHNVALQFCQAHT